MNYFDNLSSGRHCDCNNCKYLNVTESEQTNLRRLGYDAIHYCKKYDTRLYHETNSRQHSCGINPCKECEKEHSND